MENVQLASYETFRKLTRNETANAADICSSHENVKHCKILRSVCRMESLHFPNSMIIAGQSLKELEKPKEKQTLGESFDSVGIWGKRGNLAISSEK